MPKGFKGFQKGHKGFITPEGYKKRKNARYWLGKKRPDISKLFSKINKGKHFSPETEFKPTGCQGHKKLGKNDYRHLHKWVVKELGRPDTCSNCGQSGLSGHQIHWANKSGEYKKNIEDWERLCVKCHFHLYR
jgi:hypothetical protein